MRSIICDYIVAHPNNWKETLEEKKIKVKIREYNGILFGIFNYDILADFTDEIVQEARGIIIRLDTCEVVCWPFRKFGNWSEPYADKINWDHAVVQEKLDGSIIKRWFNPGTMEWQWSTNSTFDAFEAPLTDTVGSIKTFGDLITSASNYQEFLNLGELANNKELTYIFELVGPQNRIVVKYPITKLNLIGIRSNKTGDEMPIDINFAKPQEYPLKTFDDCVAAAKALNPNDNIQKEGFVVVDRSSYPDGWHRIKIKSPEYVAMHKSLERCGLSKDKAIELIFKNVPDDMLRSAKLKSTIQYYRFALAELEYRIEMYIAYVRGLYEELNYDRKALATVINKDKLARFGFKAIGNNKTGAEIMQESQLNALVKLLPDYSLPSLERIKDHLW